MMSAPTGPFSTRGLLQILWHKRDCHRNGRLREIHMRSLVNISLPSQPTGEESTSMQLRVYWLLTCVGKYWGRQPNLCYASYRRHQRHRFAGQRTRCLGTHTIFGRRPMWSMAQTLVATIHFAPFTCRLRRFLKRPKNPPQIPKYHKNTVFTRAFFKVRVNFCPLPCDTSQETHRNCSEELVQMNFLFWVDFSRGFSSSDF